MTIVNLTPHPVHLYREDDTITTIQPEPVSARVATTTREVGEIDGVPIIEEHYGQVTGLPDPKPGVLYVVARVVAAACPERRDLLIPADLVRSADGTVIGCRALARSTPETLHLAELPHLAGVEILLAPADYNLPQRGEVSATRYVDGQWVARMFTPGQDHKITGLTQAQAVREVMRMLPEAVLRLDS